MKIYISGKITGLPMKEVIEKFNSHAEFLKSEGYEPVNPLHLSPYSESKEWHDYMAEDIAGLLKCDAMYMLNDWGQSKGARVEYAIARELGLLVYHEGDI